MSQKIYCATLAYYSNRSFPLKNLTKCVVCYIVQFVLNIARVNMYNKYYLSLPKFLSKLIKYKMNLIKLIILQFPYFGRSYRGFTIL